MAKRKKKQKKPRGQAPGLTQAHRALLRAFEERRCAIVVALEASNILHHRELCLCCSLPTIAQRGNFEVCVVCLWEDSLSEAQLGWVGPPNYVSLEQARLAAAARLYMFEQAWGMGLLKTSVDALIRCFKAFQERLRAGEAELDRLSFAANLEQMIAWPGASLELPQTLTEFLRVHPRPVELRTPEVCPKHACAARTVDGWISTMDLFPSNDWMDDAAHNPLCVFLGQAIVHPSRGSYLQARVAWCPRCEYGMQELQRARYGAIT